MPQAKRQVRQWPINKLTPYAQNARTHSDAQIARIVASLQRYGWTLPILADASGTIVAGHARHIAAQALNMQKVPVIVLDDLTEDEIRAYRIADNRLSELSEWDEPLLVAELKALQDHDFDIELTGFNLDDLGAMLGLEEGAGGSDADDAPEPPDDPITQLGDVWVMGKHRLICGDCTDAETVKRVLDGAAPALMVTDPPYGVNYDPEWRSSLDSIDRATNATPNDDKADWAKAWALFGGDVGYVWHGGIYRVTVQQSLEACGFDVRAEIVWVKPHFAISRGHYHFQHEPCLYVVRKGATAGWKGGRDQSTVWQAANNTFQGKGDRDEADIQTRHANQKPVECMERPIRNHAGNVYDSFLGSGTTLIAAERQRRTCYAVEIMPAYCDVSVKRWQTYTGQQAVLEATGQPFGA